MIRLAVVFTLLLLPSCLAVRLKRKQTKFYEQGTSNASDIANHSVEDPRLERDTEALAALGYDVIEKIGNGQYGHVYKATKRDDGMLLAIKALSRRALIESGYKTEKEQTEVIAQELDNQLAVLNFNPEAKKYVVITEGLKVGKTKDSYLIMELFEKIDGQKPDLLHRMDDVPWDLDVIRPLMQKLLTGLLMCHQAGVAHIDIKPENILVRVDPETGEIIEAKLADFGLSASYSRQQEWVANFGGRLVHVGSWFWSGQRLRLAAGTPLYAAPEILQFATKTIRSFQPEPPDVWSLGTILYILVFGQVPYADDRDERTGFTIPGGQLKFPRVKDAPPQLSLAKDLIRGMLQMNPKDRLTLRQSLDHQFITGIEPCTTGCFG